MQEKHPAMFTGTSHGGHLPVRSSPSSYGFLILFPSGGRDGSLLERNDSKQTETKHLAHAVLQMGR